MAPPGRSFRAIALDPAAEARDERQMPLCRKGGLGALWRQHGLEQVSEEGLTIRTRFVSFDDYWSPLLEQQGPAGAYVAALSANEREQLPLRLRRRLLGERPDRPLVLVARAWAVRGIVPSRGRSARSIVPRDTGASRETLSQCPTDGVCAPLRTSALGPVQR